MELVKRLLSWIGFLYLTLVALSAFFLFIRLNLDLGQSLMYLAIVAVVSAGKTEINRQFLNHLVGVSKTGRCISPPSWRSRQDTSDVLRWPYWH